MEIDTLLKMKNSLEIFKSGINEVVNVKSYINGTNTNDNIIDKYNFFFNDNFLIYLTQDIEKIIGEIINKINITCEHE